MSMTPAHNKLLTDKNIITVDSFIME